MNFARVDGGVKESEWDFLGELCVHCHTPKFSLPILILSSLWSPIHMCIPHNIHMEIVHFHSFA